MKSEMRTEQWQQFKEKQWHKYFTWVQKFQPTNKKRAARGDSRKFLWINAPTLNRKFRFPLLGPSKCPLSNTEIIPRPSKPERTKCWTESRKLHILNVLFLAPHSKKQKIKITVTLRSSTWFLSILHIQNTRNNTTLLLMIKLYRLFSRKTRLKIINISPSKNYPTNPSTSIIRM